MRAASFCEDHTNRRECILRQPTLLKIEEAATSAAAAATAEQGDGDIKPIATRHEQLLREIETGAPLRGRTYMRVNAMTPVHVPPGLSNIVKEVKERGRDDSPGGSRSRPSSRQLPVDTPAAVSTPLSSSSPPPSSSSVPPAVVTKAAAPPSPTKPKPAEPASASAIASGPSPYSLYIEPQGPYSQGRALLAKEIASIARRPPGAGFVSPLRPLAESDIEQLALFPPSRDREMHLPPFFHVSNIYLSHKAFIHL